MKQEKTRTALRWVFGILFVGAGLNHFVNSAFYVSIMPDYFPAHAFLVFLSGVVEIVVGIAVCSKKLRPYSGWAAVATLLAVFPANIHMALHPEDYPDLPPAGLWIRLPLQLVLMAWAIWATRAVTPAVVAASP